MKIKKRLCSGKYSSSRKAHLFLYTPPNEHFGIGPIESMIRGVPALGINNGGPKETIDDQSTGYLLTLNPQDWADKISTLVILFNQYEDPQLYSTLSQEAKRRAQRLFSVETFNRQFNRRPRHGGP